MRDAADFVTDSGSGTRLTEAALSEAVRASGASVGTVYLMDVDSDRLRLAFLTGAPRQIAIPWAQPALTDRMPVSDAVREQRLVWVDGEEQMARRYPRLSFVLPYQFALAAAPITTGTTVRGGLVLLWRGSHPPHLSAGEHEAIRSACHRLGVILRQAADTGDPVLPGSEPRVLGPGRGQAPRPAEARAAVEFIDRLPGGSCALNRQGRITFINSAAADLVGADADELLGALPWDALEWLDDPVVENHYRSAVIGGRPVFFTALRPPDRWLSFGLHPDASGISVQITPTSAPGDPEPSDASASDASDAWDPSDVSDNSDASETSGHPARTPRASRRSTLLYPHLMHLAATLTEAISVHDVIEQTADQVMPAMGAQALALMTAEEGRLRIIGYRGYSAELMDRFDAIPLTSKTPGVHALTSGIPSFFATFAELKRAYPPAVLQDNMASWAFLPLIVSGRPIGSLVLAYDRTHPFPPGERAVLSSLAALIATALDRARLYDAKHQLARSLQSGLLPHTLPRMPGLDVAARYLPATRGLGIGGDFYDLIRLDATTAAAVIGDVQGHNPRAAALMGQVRTAVHAHASAGAPPEQVLARTNRLLTELDPGLFTSCLYIQLDLARHRVRLATAGHPPPLLRDAGGKAQVLPVPPGLLLGIEPAAAYPAVDVSLPPESVLALYTDGLVEGPDVDLDAATTALADHLAHAETHDLDALADRLVQHSAGQGDDIALLLLKPATAAPRG
jgi:PAS domain-containing protein